MSHSILIQPLLTQPILPLVRSTVTLNGTIASSNDAIVLGAVTLGSATTIDTDASDTTGDITIGAVTGGSNSLTLSTGDNVANTDIPVLTSQHQVPSVV